MSFGGKNMNEIISHDNNIVAKQGQLDAVQRSTLCYYDMHKHHLFNIISNGQQLKIQSVDFLGEIIVSVLFAPQSHTPNLRVLLPRQPIRGQM